MNEDALPPMPSWDTASERKVPVGERLADEEVELGRLDPRRAQQAPMLGGAAAAGAGYADADEPPYRQRGGNGGGELGSAYARQEGRGAYGAGYARGYGGRRDELVQRQEVGGGGYGGRGGYEAYTPSESTEFEPPSVGSGGGGGVYSPASSTVGRQYAGGQVPSGALVGRKAVANSWRDV